MNDRVNVPSLENYRGRCQLIGYLLVEMEAQKRAKTGSNKLDSKMLLMMAMA